MATYSRTEQVIENGSDFKLLPADKYIMRIVAADEVDNTYAKPNADGTPKKQVMIRWELERLTMAQKARRDNTPDTEDFDPENYYLAEDETLDDGTTVMQYMTPLYATLKDRDTGNTVPTPWKVFLDTLAAQEIIEDEFDLDNLLGVTQLVEVAKEPKKQGKNAGKMGNKVTKIGPVPSKKAAAQPPRRTAVATTPAPQTDDDELGF